MLYVSRLARQFGDTDPNILIKCRYVGLKNRRTDSHSGRHSVYGEVSTDDAADLQTQATAQQIDDNLVEVLHKLLSPLYERFSFYELSPEFVRSEIEGLRKRRF